MISRLISIAWPMGLIAGGVTAAAESLYFVQKGAHGFVPVLAPMAFAFGFLFAWLFALMFHIYASCRSRVSRRTTRLVVELLTLGLFFGLACWNLEPWWRRVALIYFVIAAFFAAGGTFMLALSIERGKLVRWMGGLLWVAASLAMDSQLQRHQYSELHSLCLLAVLLGCVPLAMDFARRVAVWPGRISVFISVGLIALSLFWLVSMDRLSPGWRFVALHRGQLITAAIRLVQKATDFDGDGFSAMAWGGDCNDRNPEIHPLAADPAGGGDSNCNGVDLNSISTDPNPVLPPPMGEPAFRAAQGGVMMFSIDSLRYDFFTAEHMPRLFALSQRGVRMERCYAGGANTETSIPLMVEPTSQRPSIVHTLREASIPTVIGTNLTSFVSGASTNSSISGSQMEITMEAIFQYAIQQQAPYLLWNHVMITHHPYQDHPELAERETPKHIPRSYKSALRFTDALLGRLWDRLEASGLAGKLTWIVTADHGEAFGEGGVTSHGTSGLDVVLRVPCALWGPGLGPRTVSSLASHRGLPATLLGLFGLAAEAEAAEFMGRSWLRLESAPAAALQELVVVRSGRSTSGRVIEGHLMVLLDDHFRFILAPEEGIVEFFQADDRELAWNLVSKYPEKVARYRTSAATVSDLDGFPLRRLSPKALKKLYDR